MIEAGIVTLFQFNFLYGGRYYEFQISSTGRLMHMGTGDVPDDDVPDKVWRAARQLAAVNLTNILKQLDDHALKDLSNPLPFD